MTTITIKTDCSYAFAIADSRQGRNHRHLIGAGPHLLAAPAWSQPGGPRGTSGEELLPAGTKITRTQCGDEYSCATWRAELPA